MKTAPGARERLLVLVRHAQAGDPERFRRETGRPDRDRPLTAEGRQHNRAAAAGLHRLLGTLDHLWSSPYARARQTAEGIAEVFDRPVEAPDFLLPPWDPGALGEWLCGRGAPVPMEKGAACALRIPDGLGRGAVELIWKLPQYGLRKL